MSVCVLTTKHIPGKVVDFSYFIRITFVSLESRLLSCSIYAFHRYRRHIIVYLHL